MDRPTVSVNLGYTLNIGNFQSVRVDMGYTDFVRDAESPEQAMERVYLFVESEAEKKIADAKNALDS